PGGQRDRLPVGCLAKDCQSALAPGGQRDRHASPRARLVPETSPVATSARPMAVGTPLALAASRKLVVSPTRTRPVALSRRNEDLLEQIFSFTSVWPTCIWTAEPPQRFLAVGPK